VSPDIPTSSPRAGPDGHDAGGRLALVGRLQDRLRVVLNPARRSPAASVPEPGPEPEEVEFIAFTEDCLIVGRISLDADRLSDMLNAHEQFTLRDVVVHGLADGRSVRAAEVPVSRAELVAVLADRPRGDPARRTHTVMHPVAVQSGAYIVHGYLHARPGAEPLASARWRRPMIPLTDASIEYALGGVPQLATSRTIVVNRDLAGWMRLVGEHELRGTGQPVTVR
jgi:hypothetical protein